MKFPSEWASEARGGWTARLVKPSFRSAQGFQSAEGTTRILPYMRTSMIPVARIQVEIRLCSHRSHRSTYLTGSRITVREVTSNTSSDAPPGGDTPMLAMPASPVTTCLNRSLYSAV